MSLLKVKFNSPRTDLAKRKELSAPVFTPRELTLMETKRPQFVQKELGIGIDRQLSAGDNRGGER